MSDRLPLGGTFMTMKCGHCTYLLKGYLQIKQQKYGFASFCSVSRSLWFLVCSVVWGVSRGNKSPKNVITGRHVRMCGGFFRKGRWLVTWSGCMASNPTSQLLSFKIRLMTESLSMGSWLSLLRNSLLRSWGFLCGA